MNIRCALAAALALGLSFAQPGAAQEFPSKTVHFIVPNAPGGSIDIMARLFQEHLQAAWGKPVVVEYKPGAGTVVGTEYVARAAPDGHTVGFIITAHVVNPSMRKLPYDTLKDLAGVTMYAISHILISATPQLPANTLGELIALAKKNPGKMSYASPGSGSSMHMAGELLKQTAGIDLLHVPFKGNAPAFPEVFSGRIELIIDPVASSVGYVKAGRLKALAVTNATRSAAMPEVPTVAETLPGFNVESFFGLVVPAATPRAVVKKLNADFAAALKTPALRTRLAEFGMAPVGNSPEEFDDFVRKEIPRWGAVVKAAGIKAD